MYACVLTRSANRTRLDGCMVSGVTQFKTVVCVCEGEKNDLTRGVRRWFGEIRRSDSRMTLYSTKMRVDSFFSRYSRGKSTSNFSSFLTI